MGNTHTLRKNKITPFGARRGRTVFALLVLVAAIAVGVSLVTTNARALPTFTDPVGGIGPCQTCHPQSNVHGTGFIVAPGTNTKHPSDMACTVCHNNGGTSNPPLPTACGACHGGTAAILGKPTHSTTGCGSTAGCHGVASPTPTPTVGALTVAAPKAASVKKGKVAKLMYQVNQAVPSGVANAKIVIKNAKKKAVKTLKATAVALNTPLTMSFKCTLAKGKYKFYVTATSVDGTASTNTASNKLTVK